MAKRIELYQLAMGESRWWRLMLVGFDNATFLALVREASRLTGGVGLIGARPKLPENETVRACGYLHAPSDDRVLAHAEAVASLANTPLELGETEVLRS